MLSNPVRRRRVSGGAPSSRSGKGLTFLRLGFLQVAKVAAESNHRQYLPLAASRRSPVQRVVHAKVLVRRKVEDADLGAQELLTDEVEVLLAGRDFGGGVVDDAGLGGGESGADGGEAFRAGFEGVLVLFKVIGVRLARVIRLNSEAGERKDVRRGRSRPVRSTWCRARSCPKLVSRRRRQPRVSKARTRRKGEGGGGRW